MDAVIEAVEGANQRGGRMLSLVDLLEAGTLSLAQAAWLLGRIEAGSSFLVGARPGGAGKTAVMGALLAMLPAGEAVRLARPGSGWEAARPGECVVAYEISPGDYDAYIWGPDVVRFARLGARGCRLVSNLHADTLQEAREQIVRQNGATEEDFLRFGLFLPVELRGGGRPERRVRRIHAAGGPAGGGGWAAIEADPPLGPAEEDAASFLEECRRAGARTIQEVRRRWLGRRGRQARAARQARPDREDLP